MTAQYLAFARYFQRKNSPGTSEATTNEAILKEFDESWKNIGLRLEVVPGKEALAFLNQKLQARYHVSLTPTAIIDAMKIDEVPAEMRELIENISKFSESPIR